jgi:hypothetical protein
VHGFKCAKSETPFEVRQVYGSRQPLAYPYYDPASRSARRGCALCYRGRLDRRHCGHQESYNGAHRRNS